MATGIQLQPLILHALAAGPKTVETLAAELGGVPPSLVKASLSQLEVNRRVTCAHTLSNPPRTLYRLVEFP